MTFNDTLKKLDALYESYDAKEVVARPKPEEDLDELFDIGANLNLPVSISDASVGFLGGTAKHEAIDVEPSQDEMPLTESVDAFLPIIKPGITFIAEDNGQKYRVAIDDIEVVYENGELEPTFICSMEGASSPVRYNTEQLRILLNMRGSAEDEVVEDEDTDEEVIEEVADEELDELFDAKLNLSSPVDISDVAVGFLNGQAMHESAEEDVAETDDAEELSDAEIDQLVDEVMEEGKEELEELFDANIGLDLPVNISDVAVGFLGGTANH